MRQRSFVKPVAATIVILAVACTWSGCNKGRALLGVHQNVATLNPPGTPNTAAGAIAPRAALSEGGGQDASAGLRKVSKGSVGGSVSSATASGGSFRVRGGINAAM